MNKPKQKNIYYKYKIEMDIFERNINYFDC